jgi:hypothetical protein
VVGVIICHTDYMKSLSHILTNKTVLVALALAAVCASIMPVFAMADVLYCNGNYGFYPDQTTCNAGGNLNVVVRVLNNQDDNTYYAPSSFVVSVAGTNVSPAQFAGSNPGTNVTLGAGTYNVQVATPAQFSLQYSLGCSSTMSQNGSALCVVTVSNSIASSPYPTPYPYPAVPQVLTCAPGFETVNIGQTASFTAYNGLGNYTWSVAGKTYINSGQTVNLPMSQTGTQVVTVNSGSQTATCTVDVVGGGAPVPSNIVVNTTPVITGHNIYGQYGNQYGNYTGNNTGYAYNTAPGAAVYSNPQNNQYGYPQITINYPHLPNTGFEPIDAAQIVFAIAALIASGIFLYPYVRKASTLGAY